MADDERLIETVPASTEYGQMIMKTATALGQQAQSVMVLNKQEPDEAIVVLFTAAYELALQSENPNVRAAFAQMCRGYARALEAGRGIQVEDILI